MGKQTYKRRPGRSLRTRNKRRTFRKRHTGRPRHRRISQRGGISHDICLDLNDRFIYLDVTDETIKDFTFEKKTITEIEELIDSALTEKGNTAAEIDYLNTIKTAIEVLKNNDISDKDGINYIANHHTIVKKLCASPKDQSLVQNENRYNLFNYKFWKNQSLGKPWNYENNVPRYLPIDIVEQIEGTTNIFEKYGIKIDKTERFTEPNFASGGSYKTHSVFKDEYNWYKATFPKGWTVSSKIVNEKSNFDINTVLTYKQAGTKMFEIKCTRKQDKFYRYTKEVNDRQLTYTISFELL